MAKTFLTVASHWSTPGIRQYASLDRAAAEAKAAELVDELREDFHRVCTRETWRGDHVPPSVKNGGGDWRATLAALQLARLINYSGGEGEANDALFEFCQGSGRAEPPLIGDCSFSAIQGIVEDFVEEDEHEPDKIGFPMVWIEEVEDAFGLLTKPPVPADLGLVIEIAQRFLSEGELATATAEDRAPYEAAIERLTAHPPADAVAAAVKALRDGKGSIGALLHQVSQMRGMFDDEDGTIQDAVDDAEIAEDTLENAIHDLTLVIEPVDDGTLYTALLRARAGWADRQAPGDENETTEQEIADNVVETLDSILKASGRALPRVLVNMDGGIIQEVTSDCEVEVVVLDYDTDGEEPEPTNSIVPIPQWGQPGRTENAFVGHWQPYEEEGGKMIDAILAAVAIHDAKSGSPVDGR